MIDKVGYAAGVAFDETDGTYRPADVTAWHVTENPFDGVYETEKHWAHPEGVVLDALFDGGTFQIVLDRTDLENLLALVPLKEGESG